MSFFNSIAFNISACYFLIGAIQQMAYYSLCRTWNIKMVTFAVFHSPKFSLLKRTIGHTEYKLGWVPFGTYIELLGADKDAYEQLDEVDKSFAVLSKPKWQRLVFKIIPYLTILVYFLTGGFLSKGLFSFFSDMTNVILKSFSVMFGSGSYEDTGAFANRIIMIHGFYSFIFFTGAFLLLFARLMDHISELIFGTEKHWTLKTIAFLYMIFMLWFMLWKVPSFFLHYFSFLDILIAAISYLTGVFLSGIIFYFSVVGVMKVRNENLGEI